eukprot:6180775-Pleurochrysis_carterae.AAC.1
MGKALSPLNSIEYHEQLPLTGSGVTTKSLYRQTAWRIQRLGLPQRMAQHIKSGHLQCIATLKI